VLGHTTERYRYFFNDYILNYFSPSNFVADIVTHLESKLFVQGELLLERKKPVDHLYFMHFGVCHLYGITEW